jgi:hypothetical protein
MNKRFQSLIRFYEEVDQTAEKIKSALGDGIKCGRGCTNCCIDDLAVLPVEAGYIRQEFGGLLEKAIPGPAGVCAMLDEAGLCRIYHARPYICRTQGLPLRWFGPGPAGEITEFRDICPVNDDGLFLIELSDEDCFLLGPFEERLQEIQARAAKENAERVPLKSLFKE